MMHTKDELMAMEKEALVQMIMDMHAKSAACKGGECKGEGGKCKGGSCQGAQ